MRAVALLAVYAILVAAATAMLFVVQAQGAVFWGSPKPRVPAAAFVAIQLLLMIAAAPSVRLTTRRWSARAIVAVSTLASVVAIAIVAGPVLLHFPNSGDEYAYMFQSWTFAAGRLWNQTPAAVDLLSSNYIWHAGARWVGQYPPGWPLTIASGAMIGISPWMLNAAFATGTALLAFALVRRTANDRAAAATAMVVLLSPFTIFNAASFFSHVMAGFFVLLACWALRVGIREERLGHMVLCGAAIGLLGITRTNSAMIAALPIGATLVLRWRWRHAMAMAAGGLPFLAGLLLYQRAITGDALTPVYYLGGRTVDHLYFDFASIRTGIGLTLGKVVETSLWIAPLALPLWLLATVSRIRERSFDAVDAIFPLAVLIFTFYPLDPGDRYGPRYYFEFWPLMVVTIASATAGWSARWRRLTASAAVLTVIYGLVLLPFLARDYHRIVVERTDPFRQAAAHRLDKAVVCVTTKSGIRPLWPTDHARNGITADGPVLFAHCENVSPETIRATFPERRIWFYERDPGEAVGRLRPDRPLSASAR